MASPALPPIATARPMQSDGSSLSRHMIAMEPIGASTSAMAIGISAENRRGIGARQVSSILRRVSGAGASTYPAKRQASIITAADARAVPWLTVQSAPENRRLNDPSLCPAGNGVDLVAGNALSHLVRHRSARRRRHGGGRYDSKGGCPHHSRKGIAG